MCFYGCLFVLGGCCVNKNVVECLEHSVGATRHALAAAVLPALPWILIDLFVTAASHNGNQSLREIDLKYQTCHRITTRVTPAVSLLLRDAHLIAPAADAARTPSHRHQRLYLRVRKHYPRPFLRVDGWTYVVIVVGWLHPAPPRLATGWKLWWWRAVCEGLAVRISHLRILASSPLCRHRLQPPPSIPTRVFNTYIVVACGSAREPLPFSRTQRR